jgi:ADP-L-glycero-D-manno-heptose 6-epimerase
MIAVTGAAGFIGSNLVRALNERGCSEVLAVDNLTRGEKFQNLVDCEIADLLEPEAFLEQIERDAVRRDIQAVFHQGACSNTMSWDGRAMLRSNYDYSKRVLEFCQRRRIPLIYASSAAVYGRGGEFRVDPVCERPLNVYGYSKLLFDRYLRRRWAARTLRSQVVGLRYFNVYGPREQHKGEMASVAYKQHQQLLRGDRVQLFGAYGGYGPGEHLRDFVWVGDVVAVNLFFLDQPQRSGIFNVGTGRAQSFNDVARAVIAYHGRGEIEYTPFPEALSGRYQTFTQADISELREAGYAAPFLSVEEGVPLYMKWLEERGA